MRSLLREYAALSLSVIGLSVSMSASALADVLPVQNLTFSDYSGPAPKDYFNTVDPADWYRGPHDSPHLSDRPENVCEERPLV